MDLSIIIVSWNVQEKLEKNLQAIFQSQGLKKYSGEEGFTAEVFVVDNNSTDKTRAMVREKFPAVKLVSNNKNYGFAYAVNQVLPEAQGKFILLLNPDMEVEKDTLKIMLEKMRSHAEVAGAGCKLKGKDNKVVQQIRRFPTLLDQLAMVLKLRYLFPWLLNKYLCSDFDYQQSTIVDSVRGSFLMLRKETIDKIGYLDERFFIWFEDVDYCRRIKEANLQLWYFAEAECFDYVGQSFQQVKKIKTQKYFRDSMLKYFEKWHPSWQVNVLKLAWILIWPIVLFISLFV